MTRLTAADYQAVAARAVPLVCAADLELALDRMAADLTSLVGDRDPLVLCVMTGGVVVTGRLLPRLNFALRLDYVHATRYQGGTSGGVLQWLHRPSEAIRGEHVVVIDDIFDEGLTMAAIVAACEADGAAGVTSAVLVEKLREHRCDYRPDVVGLTVPDRYVIGAGLDYRGYFRNVAGILAIAEQDV